MSGGDVVCSGWLRKSPPEKKLRRYAWKKRWFVLRSGRLTGDPDVLEYYKNDHTRKPIRVIDLNLCEQVDAGLTFNKKDLEHSFIFDIKTFDRVFYLVADTEEEMNKWVRCICDICGFNPTEEDSGKPSHHSSSTAMDVLPHPVLVTTAPSPINSLPPPYQPVSIRHQGSSSSLAEAQDYLLLVNCESKKPTSVRPHAGSSRSTSSETDCNDNLPSHMALQSSVAMHASANGFFGQHHSLYDSPPCRGTLVSAEAGLYHLPRSYSQDTVLQTRSAPCPDGDLAGEHSVFSTPSRKASVESQMQHVFISQEAPATPGTGSTYQIPRMVGPEGAGLLDAPPPRPPKPVPSERSPTETYYIPRSVSESDGNYCFPTSAKHKALRSNTIGTVDSSGLRKEYGSQDCYDIPRSFPSHSPSSASYDLNESFSTYLKNKGMVPVGSGPTEEVGENYVHMGGNSPSHQRSGSLSEPTQEPNYVPMTPSNVEFSALGKQVPPPAHMGFRASPKTPPRRPVLSNGCQPPPVDRNLKPDRKAKPAPLEIKPSSEWEELPAPVRSPVTRSFARDPTRFPMPPRPPSVHSTTSSTDSEDCEENYVAMTTSSGTADEPNVKLSVQMNVDGSSSPMVKPRGEKQVEYLDLDLDPSKSTPPRKKKSNGAAGAVSDERVDYVVVDQHRTQALKNTREAWNDGRQSTESDAPSKGPK